MLRTIPLSIRHRGLFAETYLHARRGIIISSARVEGGREFLRIPEASCQGEPRQCVCLSYQYPFITRSDVLFERVTYLLFLIW